MKIHHFLIIIVSFLGIMTMVDTSWTNRNNPYHKDMTNSYGFNFREARNTKVKQFKSRK